MLSNNAGREKSRPETVLCGDARSMSRLDPRAVICLRDAGRDGGEGSSHPRFGLKRQGIGNDEAYARNDLFKNFKY